MVQTEYEFSEEFAEGQIRDIRRNLRNLFRIPKNSVPLARGMGLKWNSLSQIPPELENDYATDVVEVVETYEPRVSVDRVEFKYDNEGKTICTVHLEKGDD